MDIYPLCSHNAIEEEEEPQPRHQDFLPLWARVCRKEVCFYAAPFPGKQEGKLPTKKKSFRSLLLLELGACLKGYDASSHALNDCRSFWLLVSRAVRERREVSNLGGKGGGVPACARGAAIAWSVSRTGSNICRFAITRVKPRSLSFQRWTALDYGNS